MLVGPSLVFSASVQPDEAASRFLPQTSNNPPQITSTPVTTADVDELYSYDVEASDLDNDPIEYILTQAPEGMSIDAGTGLITWIPTLAQVGDHNVTVLVGDGQEEANSIDTQTFIITVEIMEGAENRPPEITSTPVTTAQVGLPYIYDVEAIDPDGTPLFYFLTNGPEGMEIDLNTGLISWIPTSSQVGTHQVEVLIGGDLEQDGIAFQNFDVEVTSGDHTPTPTPGEGINHPFFTSTPVTSAIVGQLYSYDVDATDPDGTPLIYLLINGPEGMEIDLNTGLISWTPSSSQIGSHPVEVRTGGETAQEGTAFQNFDVEVTSGGPTPTATNTATPTATATNTPVPPTATATATGTAVPPTATATPTATNTPAPPTATPTATATATPTTPDVPILISPDDGSTTGDATPTFDWQAVAGTNVMYELQVDDTDTFTTPLVHNVVLINNTTTHTIPGTQALAPGQYFWRVRAINGSVIGDFSTVRSFTVVVVPTPTTTPTAGPLATVDILSPSDRSAVASSPINVSGTLTGAANIQSVTVNGITAQISGSNWTVSNIALLEGPNVIQAVATDTNNNISTDVINVTLDTSAPTVAITNQDGLITSDDTINIFGNVQDAVLGTVNGSQATVTVNGITAAVSNRTFLAQGVPLSTGDNTITAIATDTVGNTSSDSITVTLDQSVALKVVTFSGNNQTADIESKLIQPLIAQVTDNNDDPVANRNLVFRVIEGDGTLTSSSVNIPKRAISVLTDAQGKAQVDFTLGTRSGSGNNKVKASSVGVAVEAVFIATGLSSTPDKVNVGSGDKQLGAINQPLAHPLVAIATDTGNNRIPNLALLFTVISGGGKVEGQDSVVVNTDGDGRAAVNFILGPDPGFDTHSVVVTFNGQTTNFPATFTASALAPGNPQDTIVSGVVLNNSNIPLEGVEMSIEGFSATTLTDAQGLFTLTFPSGNVPIGINHLVADGSTVSSAFYPTLMFEIDIISGARNILNSPIYLLALNVANAKMVGGSDDVTFDLQGMPGFSFTVLAGSATFPNGSTEGLVSVTQVHSDKVPMVPPDGMQWPLVVTIQPPNVHFDPPAPFTLPNIEGLPPGSKAELFSFDHDLGDFVSVGWGTVSENGSVIKSDPGFGIVKGGWHGGGNPSGGGGGGGGGGPY